MSKNTAKRQTEPKSKEIVINDKFHFGLYSLDVLKTNQALEYFRNHLLKGDEWLYSGEMPIFIDTNILIDLYSSSHISRNAFLNFMEKNAHRIIIPRHVLDEYMSHRMGDIEKIPNEISKKRETLLNLVAELEDPISLFKHKIANELNQRGFLHEAPSIKDCLAKILDILESKLKMDDTYNELIKRTQNAISISEEDMQIVTQNNDVILATVCKLQLLNSLTDKEKTYLEELFETMYEKPKKEAFPGRGDKEHCKETNVYGDFFIYHEMMKYIAAKGTDAVFLTKDITKGDWIRKDRKPHMHYIIDSFANSGHILYIVDANGLSFGMKSDDSEDDVESGKTLEDIATSPESVANTESECIS